jgi:hypothetical protein
MLDDTIILAHPAIDPHNNVEDNPDEKEADHLVKKGAVCHDDGPIVERLLNGVVAAVRAVMVVRPATQDGEFLVQIPVQKGQQRDDREDDARGQRGDDGCKGGSEAGFRLSLVSIIITACMYIHATTSNICMSRIAEMSGSPEEEVLKERLHECVRIRRRTGGIVSCGENLPLI